MCGQYPNSKPLDQLSNGIDHPPSSPTPTQSSLPQTVNNLQPKSETVGYQPTLTQPPKPEAIPLPKPTQPIPPQTTSNFQPQPQPKASPQTKLQPKSNPHPLPQPRRNASKAHLHRQTSQVPPPANPNNRQLQPNSNIYLQPNPNHQLRPTATMTPIPLSSTSSKAWKLLWLPERLPTKKLERMQ